MTLDETIALARAVGAKVPVPHHLGMLDLKTVDPVEIDSAPRRRSIRKSIGPRSNTSSV